MPPNVETSEARAPESLSSTLKLDGSPPSPAEHARAQHGVTFLTALAARLPDPVAGAQALLDAAELVGRALGDVGMALELVREAFKRAPSELHVTRAYACASLAAGSALDFVIALDAEARAAPAGPGRASLRAEQGAWLQRSGEDASLVRAEYREAVLAHPTDVHALSALERAMHGDEGSAKYAIELASATVSPEMRAEHLVRAARIREAGADLAESLEITERARTLSPSSPAVLSTLERLYARKRLVPELVALRLQQVQQSLVSREPAALDVAVLALVSGKAPAALEEALNQLRASQNVPVRAFALEALEARAAAAGTWAAVVELAEQRAGTETDDARRAVLLARAARIAEGRLLDDAAAARLYDEALKAKASPTLAESAAAFYERTGDRDATTRALEAMVETAPSQRSAARARVRLAVHLLRDRSPRTIELLGEASAHAGGDPTPLHFLELVLRRDGQSAVLAAVYARELGNVKDPVRRSILLMRYASVLEERLSDRRAALTQLEEALALDVPWEERESLERLVRLAIEDPRPQLLNRLLDPPLPGIDAASLGTLYERRAETLRAGGADPAAMDACDAAALAVAPFAHPVRAHALARLPARRRAALCEETSATAETPLEKAAWLLLAARAYDLADDRKATLRCARAAASAAPDDLETREELVFLLTRGEHWDELFEALRSDESTPRLLARAALAERAEDVERALRCYLTARERGIDGAELPHLRMLTQTEQWKALAAAYATTQLFEAAHALHRAGEAQESAGERDAACDSYEKAMEASQSALSSRLRLAFITTRPERKATALRQLCELVTDAPSRLGLLKELATCLDENLDEAGAFAVRMQILELAPRDPVAEIHVIVALSKRGERTELHRFRRARATDASIDPALRSASWLAVATLSEELGAHRDAADALETALAGPPGSSSRWAQVSRVRMYRLMNDRPGEERALIALAESLGSTPEAAICHRLIAREREEEGELEEAIKAYLAALACDPCDYEALRRLEVLADGERTMLIDPLMRVVAAETDPEMLGIAARALATRLLEEGRIAPAAEALDRALAVEPDRLSTLLLRAEAAARGQEFEHCVTLLRTIAAHPDADESVRNESEYRLATLLAVELQQPDEARVVAASLAARGTSDRRSLERRAEIEEMLEDYPAVARTLEILADKGAEESPHAHAETLLRLASLREDRLDDSAGAIRALGEVRHAEYRLEAVSRLLTLGERTGRWDLASVALESALDSYRGDDAQWELAIRRRLASLLEGPLGRTEAAVRQYERIVEVEPSATDAIRRLVALSSSDPAKSANWHRRLLEAEPSNPETLRALRSLLVEAGANDAAFCAEAVLDGLGAADEEIAYFYRQRRALLPPRIRGKVTAERLRAAICPEHANEALDVLRVLDPLAGAVFATDWAAIGVDPSTSRPPADVAALVAEIAEAFGMPVPELVAVPIAICPSVEPGVKPHLLIPADIANAVRRERQFVIGALLARVLVGGVAIDPARRDPLPQAHVGYFVHAAVEAVVPSHKPSVRGVVYEDVKRRVLSRLDAVDRAALEVAARRFVDAGAMLDVAAIIEAQSRAAARAAMLASEDPSLGTSSLATRSAMFGGTPGTRSRAGDAGIAFGVGVAHGELRSELQIGVGG